MASVADGRRSAAWLHAVDVQLLAIGVPCGSATGPETDGGMHIRLGGHFLPLTRPAFAAWWQLLRPRAPRQITGWVEQERLGSGSAVLDEIYSQGLVISWHSDALADMPTVAAMRLLPVGLGMGSTALEQERCSITFGFMGGSVAIPPVAYTVWAACDGRTPLGEACRRAAAALGMQVDEVWTEFHAVLPELTAAGMALLDRP